MRTLVCGSGFGRHYADACAKHPDLSLVGVLARGSERSRRLAEHYRVPLYLSEDGIPDEIDLACVAVEQRHAEPLVTDLLARGTSVLTEHPVSTGLLDRALRSASASGAAFHVNYHISDYSIVGSFIREARALLARHRPLFVSCFTSPRCVHSLIEILARALGTLHPLQELRSVSCGGLPRKDGSALALNAATCTLSGLPCSFQLTSHLSACDDLSDAFLNHQITLGFETGNLVLVDSLGPVVWCSRGLYSVVSTDARAAYNPGAAYERDDALQDMIADARREALQVALVRLRDSHVQRSNPENQSARYLRQVAELSARVELALRRPSSVARA